MAPQPFDGAKTQYLELQRQIEDKKIHLYHLGVYLHDPIYAHGFHAERVRTTMTAASNVMADLGNAHKALHEPIAAITTAESNFANAKALIWKLLDQHTNSPLFPDRATALKRKAQNLEELQKLKSQRAALVTATPTLRGLGKHIRQEVINILGVVNANLKSALVSETGSVVKSGLTAAITAVENLLAATIALHYKQLAEHEPLAVMPAPASAAAQYHADKEHVKKLRTRLREIYDRLGMAYALPEHEKVVFRIYDLERRLAKRHVNVATNAHFIAAKTHIAAARKDISSLTTIPDGAIVKASRGPLSDEERTALHSQANQLLKQLKEAKTKLKKHGTQFKTAKPLNVLSDPDVISIRSAKQHLLNAESEFKLYKSTATTPAEKAEAQSLVAETAQLAHNVKTELSIVVSEETGSKLPGNQTILHPENPLEAEYRAAKLRVKEVRSKLSEHSKNYGFMTPDVSPKHFKLVLRVVAFDHLLKNYSAKDNAPWIKEAREDLVKLTGLVKSLLNVPEKQLATRNRDKSKGAMKALRVQGQKLISEYIAAKLKVKELYQRLKAEGFVKHRANKEDADIMEAKRLARHIVELLKKHNSAAGGRLSSVEILALENESKTVEQELSTKLDKAVEIEASEIVAPVPDIPHATSVPVHSNDTIPLLKQQIKTVRAKIHEIQMSIDAHIMALGRIPELKRIREAVALGQQAVQHLKGHMDGPEHSEQVKHYEFNLRKSLEVLTKHAVELEHKENAIAKPTADITSGHQSALVTLENEKKTAIAELYNLLHRLWELFAQSEFIVPVNAEDAIKSIHSVAYYMRKLSQIRGPHQATIFEISKLVDHACFELHDCHYKNATTTAPSAAPVVPAANTTVTSPVASTVNTTVSSQAIPATDATLTSPDAAIHRAAIGKNKGRLLHLQQGAELKEFRKELYVYQNLHDAIDLVRRARETKKSHPLYTEKDLLDVEAQLAKDLTVMTNLIIPPTVYPTSHKVKQTVAQIEANLKDHRIKLNEILAKQPGHQDAEKQLKAVRTSLKKAKDLLQKLETVETSPAAKADEHVASNKVQKAIDDVNSITHEEVEDHAHTNASPSPANSAGSALPASTATTIVPVITDSSSATNAAPSPTKTGEQLQAEFATEKAKLDQMISDYHKNKTLFCSTAGATHPHCSAHNTLIKETKKLRDKLQSDLIHNPHAPDIEHKKVTLASLEQLLSGMKATDSEAKNSSSHKYNTDLSTQKQAIHEQRNKVNGLGAQLKHPVDASHHTEKSTVDSGQQQKSQKPVTDSSSPSIAAKHSKEDLKKYAVSLADNLLQKSAMKHIGDMKQHHHSIWDMVIEHLKGSSNAHKEAALLEATHKKHNVK
ncbi:hypothetical protein PSACC_01706 [Paramicrosporidium saccamoebae]|uniref:Uncharacterized protein n=1 Tax=Paramicrosporidium saccamoebae TaxID=1246581 RepID=A0A2H9TL34_9FUNG|nr:hypothetical protein PSACC_01706 [Paramicrosporidium saccamoebae]